MPDIPPADTSRRAAVLRLLAEVVDPCSIATGAPIDLIDMGLLKAIDFGSDGGICVTLRLTSPMCWQVTNIIAAVESRLTTIAGPGGAACRIDPMPDWMPDMMAATAQARLRRLRPVRP